MSGSPSSSASDYRSTWSSASWSGGGCCWETYDNGVRKAITSDPDGTRLRIEATLSGRLEEAVEVSPPDVVAFGNCGKLGYLQDNRGDRDAEANMANAGSES